MKNSITDLVFVDSNVLVYARDTSHAAKQRQASAWMTELWRSRRGRLSFQVLTEYYVTVTRKLRPGLDEETARQDVRALLAWKPVSLDKRILEEAWQMQDRHRLSFWDALILGAAQARACRYLLTDDLQHQQRIGNVVIVNPFRSPPESLS
ncbi:MAG TPA: PIN domain-containing protein [Acidobacteriota bacterium]|nr:PIN domain-containing protein [Acidobacteriota bacterium]